MQRKVMYPRSASGFRNRLEMCGPDAARIPGNEADEEGIASCIWRHHRGHGGIFCRRSDGPVRRPGSPAPNRSDGVDRCRADPAAVICRPETWWYLGTGNPSQATCGKLSARYCSCSNSRRRCLCSNPRQCYPFCDCGRPFCDSGPSCDCGRSLRRTMCCKQIFASSAR